MNKANNTNKYRISLDAMGGDYAPEETILGAIEACKHDDTEILLVGEEKAMSPYIPTNIPSNLKIIPSNGVIYETDSPIEAMKQKPTSSILVSAMLVKDGKADAYVSMGSTGAAMAAGVMCLGTLDGIDRPALGGPFLGLAPNTTLVDLGTSVDSRPSQLLNYAVLGVAFSKIFCNISNPRVALLSIGTEEGKGNRQVREAYTLLSRSNLNFIGNVEGMDIPQAKADVIVCDGFVGNILMKFTEGLGTAIVDYLNSNLGDNRETSSNMFIQELNKLTNFADYMGGAPLLGLNGISIVGHGRSRARSIVSAIDIAKTAIRRNFVGIMSDELRNVKQ
jgi:glycerol-3-phosphate acyltransferase PlsX